ncbi:MAG: TIR domain-containing protein [Pontixanthobacter sp.]
MHNGDQPAPAEHIFLSYARDDQAAALPIIEALTAAGIDVWWDGLIDGGAKYGLITEEALENATAVVVLWSRTSVQSHWVKDEATRGRDRGRLVPVSIDKSEPPLGFGQFQCIDLSQKLPKSGDPQFDRLVGSIRTLQGQKFEAAPKAAIPLGPAVSRRNIMIGGGVALAGAAGLTAWFSGALGTKLRQNSIAVLPFEALERGEDQAYIAEGLAAEVRARLARNPLLKVSAQTSSDAAREGGKDATDICRKLGVAFMLDGNVRRTGDQIRVVAELIDGKTGFSQKSFTYDQAIEDIFEIQSAIAAAVIQELSAAMEGDTDAPREIGGTDNVAAYEAFLRGWELYNAGIDENSDRQALAKFEEAIALDANYAAAHAGRSRSLGIIGNLYGAPQERAKLFKESIEAARKAVGIAPKFADGYSVLGYAITIGQLDMGKAREPYKLSAELGAGDADVLSRFAIFSSRMGDDAAASKAINLSTSLDPLNARTFRTTGDIAYNARRYTEALTAYDKAKSIQDGLSSYHYSIGLVKLAMDDPAGALASFKQESRTVWQHTGSAIAEFKLGNPSAAQQHFDALQSEYGAKSNYQYAQILGQWGKLKEALAALNGAWDLRDSGLVQLYQDPLMEPLRGAPEFTAIIKRMGFAN